MYSDTLIGSFKIPSKTLPEFFKKGKQLKFQKFRYLSLYWPGIQKILSRHKLSFWETLYA